MDTSAWGLVGTVVITSGSLAIGWLTRRSAKDHTAVGGFTALTTAQTDWIDRLAGRVTALEKDREEQKRLAREHVKWDRLITGRLREALPDEEFPDPPPLDT